MTLETFLMFFALAAMAAMGLWVNVRASDIPALVLSYFLVLVGVGGMGTIVIRALIGG